MTAPTVIHPHLQPADAPEVIFINALVDQGEFLPIRWGIAVEDLEIFSEVYKFCEEYQAKSHEAPPRTLLRAMFPRFPEVRGIGIEYDAHILAKEAETRRFQLALGKAVAELHNGDIDKAKDIVATTQVDRRGTKPGHSVFEHSSIDDIKAKWSTPYPPLNRATRGGMSSAELWYLCALAKHGKTMIVCHYVASLLNQGLRVSYLSLEVPTRTINHRVRRSMATPAELKLLDATKDNVSDITKVNEAIDMQQERIPGELHVFDSTHGQFTAATVRYHCANSDVVVIDHVGLLRTAEGKRAVDDWRLYATISNDLLEIKNATGTSILAAAQLNRAAHGGGDRAPASDKVGGAYQLVQDADVLITMKRMGKKAMVHASRSVREGEELTWYSRFDVDKSNYSEITFDKAMELKIAFPDDISF